MRVWGALGRRKRALRPTAANPAPTPRVTGMEFSPGAVGARPGSPGLVSRLGASGRRGLSAAKGRRASTGFGLSGPPGRSAPLSREAGRSHPRQGFKNSPGEIQATGRNISFFMCKKCFASRREHNRCKFQHTGPLPRAPTAIAASRPKRGHGFPDPDLGTASAPCGRPAPDPAGLEGRNGRRGGPEGSWSRRAGKGAGPRRGPGGGPKRPEPPQGAEPRPARARVPPRGRPHGAPRGMGGGGRRAREGRSPPRCGRTPAPAAKAPALLEGLPGGARPGSARCAAPPCPPATPVCTFSELLIPGESRFVVRSSCKGARPAHVGLCHWFAKRDPAFAKKKNTQKKTEE